MVHMNVKLSYFFLPAMPVEQLETLLLNTTNEFYLMKIKNNMMI